MTSIVSLAQADKSVSPPAALPTAARVMGLVDWRFPNPMFDYDTSFDERIDQLGEIIGRQIIELASINPEMTGNLVLCSSFLPKILTDVPVRIDRLISRVGEVCGTTPSALVLTYECASWGCVWRCQADHGNSDDFLFTVVDACMHGFTWFAGHPSIGVSGFGLTSVHLRLPATNRSSTVQVEGPYPDSGFKEFVRTLRSRQARVGSRRVMVPYFREDLGAIAQRIVGAEHTTRNRNADYGHCFGSDPWIALAKEVEEGTVQANDLVTLGTLAYNGYFAVADVHAPEIERVRHHIWP